MKKTDSFLASQLFGVLLSFLPVAHIVCAAEPAAKVIYFDLPGQSLQSGLIEFALQADISIVVDNALIEGHRSPPLAGPRTIETALGNTRYASLRGDHTDITDELNRYLPNPVRLADPALGRMEITAVIQLNDMQLSLAALAQSLRLKLETNPAGYTLHH